MWAMLTQWMIAHRDARLNEKFIHAVDALF
jgi:hypothetical protein